MAEPAASLNSGTDLPVVAPTAVHWRILALVAVYVAMCHFNRISMSVAGNERILKDHASDISTTTMGWVYTSYLIVYTICMTPGGWLIDRRGPRAALVLMGFGSAGFVALTGLVGMAFTTAGLLVAALLLVRGLLGFVTAPVHPSGARLVGHWAPLTERIGANGLVVAAACVGIASTYYVFGSLMDWLGWPAAFVVASGVTAILAVIWAWYATDRPGQHPAVNPAERALLEADEPAHEPTTPSLAETWSLLRNRSLIYLTLSYAAVGYVQYLFFYWIEHYFEDELKLGKDTSRLASTICTLAMGVGMFGGGWLADRLQYRIGRRWALASVPAISLLFSAGLLILGIATTDPTWIVIWFALALAGVGTAEGPSWTAAVELGGRRGGTAAGILNTGGNAGGLVAPVLSPFIGERLGWPFAIGLGAIICVVGAILWFWVDPAERVAELEPVEGPLA